MIFSATVAWIREAGSELLNGVVLMMETDGAVTPTSTSLSEKSRESGDVSKVFEEGQDKSAD